MATPRRFIVIGGDAAGLSAASRLKRLDPSWEIHVYERGKHISYASCGIPYYIGKEVGAFDDLFQMSVEAMEKKRDVRMHLGHEVTAIDRDAKTVQVVELASGATSTEPYDALLIATGARPIEPPIPGYRHERVVAIDGIESADRIRRIVEEKTPAKGHVVIVGGGFIGLEMAEAFRAHDLEVTIVSRAAQYPPGAMAPTTACVEKALRAAGVAIHGDEEVVALEHGPERTTVRLAGGQRFEADLVLMAVGVHPVNDLARDAGLDLGVQGAIVVDRQARTSDPSIYAAGDCAEAYHRVLDRNVFLPLALGANRMGRMVGDVITGSEVQFPGVLGTMVIKVFGCNVARTGLTDAEARAEGYDVAVQTISHPSRPHYMPQSVPLTVTVVFDRTSGRLLGAQLAGEGEVAKRIDVFATAISAGMTIVDVAGLDLAYAPPFAPVYDPVVMACQVAQKKLA